MPSCVILTSWLDQYAFQNVPTHVVCHHHKQLPIHFTGDRLNVSTLSNYTNRKKNEIHPYVRIIICFRHIKWKRKYFGISKFPSYILFPSDSIRPLTQTEGVVFSKTEMELHLHKITLFLFFTKF